MSKEQELLSENPFSIDDLLVSADAELENADKLNRENDLKWLSSETQAVLYTKALYHLMRANYFQNQAIIELLKSTNSR